MSSTLVSSTLTKQIEIAVGNDEIEIALELMRQSPAWEDAACQLGWRLGWAISRRQSGELADQQYSQWRSNEFALQILANLRGKDERVIDRFVPYEQTLARLLCNVRRYVIAVKQRQSDENSPMPLPLRLEQESVTPGHRRLQPVPVPDKRDEIHEIYRWSQGSLLLLGNPGSGKTFTLMQIAADLLSVVRDDPTAPIPLPLDLADWRPRFTDFADFVVEGINRSFLVEPALACIWLREQRLVLLLDGLNAITDREERAACVTGINEFLVGYNPAGLVVCSRPQEYFALPNQLALEVAVHIEPLDLLAIRAYLITDKTLAPELRQALLTDNALAQICETPLGFGVVRDAFAAGDFSLEDAPEAGSAATRRQGLLAVFLDRIVERGNTAFNLAGKESTEYWLSWLAKKMTDHQMNLLWFERIQPSWLPGGLWQIGYYALTRICFGLIAGILAGILIGLGLGATAENFWRGVVEGMTAATAGGVVMGILDSRWQNRFRTLDNQKLRSLLNIAVIFAIVFVSAFVFFMLGLGPVWCSLFCSGESDCAIDYRLFAAEAAAVASLTGLSFALVFGVESKEGPRSVLNDIQCGVVERLDLSRERAIRFGLFGIGLGAVAGAVLAFVYWRFGTSGNPTLELVVELHRLLGKSVPVIILTIPVIALVCGLIGGIFGSITGMAIYPKSRKRPDQPIWLLLKNATLIGLTGTVLAVPLFWFLGTIAGSTSVWIYGIFVGFLAFLGYGGLSLFLYICLRGLLALRADTPPIGRYIPFLNAMTELRLLYPTLGGYRFHHPLWQEHFAHSFVARRELLK